MLLTATMVNDLKLLELYLDLINLTFSSIIYHIRFDLQAQITRSCYSKEKIYLCLIMDILYLELKQMCLTTSV